ncbi:MAG: DUF4062 domain-containing protein [Phycisphaerae bacterium]|nr:DUF4062 domain-containing protein [Phycisphaerae bacterium]
MTAPSATSATPDRTIRVFVSSTFRDMHAERDHLVTVVFPELRSCRTVAAGVRLLHGGQQA